MSKRKGLQVDLIRDPILRSILLFALPILLSNAFQQLYNTVDTMIVGNILGETSLAAIGASSAIYDLIIGFGLGVGNGMSIVIARSFGAGEKDRLKQAVAGSVVVGVLITVLIMVVGSVGMYPLLKVLHTPESILQEAYSYIHLIVLFVGVIFAYNLCAGLLRAVGNSFMPLIFLVLSSVLNVVLDLLFIGNFGMGLRGAAVATIVAQGASAVLCIIYIQTKAKILVPKKVHFQYDKNLYRELAGQGLSMGLMHGIVVSGTVALQGSINNLGELTIAGHVTARKIIAFSMMPSSTIGSAMATFVSQNYGANKGDRILKGVNTGFIIQFIWGGIATVLMVLFSRDLMALISGSTKELILSNGAHYLIFASPFFAVLGPLMILRNSLQALGQKIIPLISSVIELIGKFVFSLLIVPLLGYTGVILCEPLIWCAMTLQLFYSFYHNPYIKKIRKSPITRVF